MWDEHPLMHKYWGLELPRNSLSGRHSRAWKFSIVICVSIYSWQSHLWEWTYILGHPSNSRKVRDDGLCSSWGKFSNTEQPYIYNFWRELRCWNPAWLDNVVMSPQPPMAKSSISVRCCKKPMARERWGILKKFKF